MTGFYSQQRRPSFFLAFSSFSFLRLWRRSEKAGIVFAKGDLASICAVPVCMSGVVFIVLGIILIFVCILNLAFCEIIMTVDAILAIY